MTKNHFMDVNIVACDIIRDEQGLALSSRNIYLKEDEKKRATKMVMAGVLSVEVIKKEIFTVLEEADEVEYVAIVNREFNVLKEIEIGNTIILVAA